MTALTTILGVLPMALPTFNSISDSITTRVKNKLGFETSKTIS